MERAFAYQNLWFNLSDFKNTLGMRDKSENG